ncbi:MAG: hypothetical protein ACYS17_02075, partial [Planctomycetota bacterium]
MTFPTSSLRGHTTTLLCAILIICLGNPSFAQNAHPEDEAALSRQTRKLSRPMLLFTTEKLERLHKRIDEDKLFSEAWGKVLGRANRLLDAELVSKEYAEGGTGQHGNYKRPSSQIVDMAGTLGLAYRMTGVNRYAEKLRDALIHYGTLRRWAGDA